MAAARPNGTKSRATAPLTESDCDCIIEMLRIASIYLRELACIVERVNPDACSVEQFRREAEHADDIRKELESR